MEMLLKIKGAVSLDRLWFLNCLIRGFVYIYIFVLIVLLYKKITISRFSWKPKVLSGLVPIGFKKTISKRHRCSHERVSSQIHMTGFLKVAANTVKNQ
jgi:hypothetical protein